MQPLANVKLLATAIAAHLGLPLTEFHAESGQRWRVSLYQTTSHQRDEHPAWQFTLGIHPQLGGLSVLRYGPGENTSNTKSTYLPLDMSGDIADQWRYIERHAVGLNWCANEACQADLTLPESVIREYVDKDGGDPCHAGGNYRDGEFVSERFDGFGGGRFDLLDDSDTCAHCEQSL